MVEIRYSDQYDITDLAGQTISIVRDQYKSEFGIPDIASVELNCTKIKRSAETSTVLSDDDILVFVVYQGLEAYLVGALLQVLVITAGMFAYDFINAPLHFPLP